MGTTASMGEFQFPMHLAAAEGDTEGVRRLIDLGMSVDTQDEKGATLRHWATIHHNSGVMELLNHHKCAACNMCARVGESSRVGYTPLLIAAMFGHRDVVDLLLRRGASVSLSGRDGVCFATFLHWASRKEWLDIVQRVLERGEDVIEATTGSEQTPLMYTAKFRQKDDAAFLIQARPDVNHRDVKKRTVLHYSSEGGRLGVVLLLLEKEGLDLNPQDCIGETPLHKACRHGQVVVVEKLLAAGANPSIKNEKGETAFRIGIRKQAFCPKAIRLCVQNGVFFEDCDYAHILKNSYLKEHVLKDVEICTQSIVNEFHYQALPALYCNPDFAKNLPRNSKLRLNTQEIQDIKNFVKLDIRTNMFCDVLKARPIVLKVMCVKSLITTPAPIFKKMKERLLSLIRP